MSIDKDLKNLKKNINAIAVDIVPRMSASAINKVAAKIRRESIKQTAQAVKVPTKLIKSRVLFRRARDRKAVGVLAVNITALPVIRLAQAVNVKVNKGSLKIGKHIFQNAFAQRLKSGHIHIMQRQSQARYPVDVAKIGLNEPFTTALKANTQDYQKEVGEQLKIIFTKELQKKGII